jgi:hypothetical protein
MFLTIHCWLYHEFYCLLNFSRSSLQHDVSDQNIHLQYVKSKYWQLITSDVPSPISFINPLGRCEVLSAKWFSSRWHGFITGDTCHQTHQREPSGGLLTYGRKYHVLYSISTDNDISIVCSSPVGFRI